MAAKRIIPCLDVKDGRVVKGIHFQGLRDMGSPVDLAARYDTEGADELVFLDIAAGGEARATREAWVEAVARCLSIPFTVGGGIASVEAMRRLLRCGADKVSLNSAAVADPGLVVEGAATFGTQCIVVAVDVARDPAKGWRVFVEGGRRPTELAALDWLERLVTLGAGEILLTSIDRDGTGSGFDLDLLRAASTLPIPVIASGGAGAPEHFREALEAGADAVLAAPVFHEGRIPIPDLKTFLAMSGLDLRR